MAFNLIRENWLTVRRADGSFEHIAPWRIVEKLVENPTVAVAWPRPDFNGATLEFPIGLLSTIFAPRNLDEWLDRWETPPSADELYQAFESIASAFYLDGNGPCFLQEFGDLEEPTRRDIATLMIEQPGEQGLERHADFFVKRGGVTVLSRASAAIALYTVQTYSPAGGRGFLTSMRGGGPLTTLAIPDRHGAKNTLWHQLWANVPTIDGPDWRWAPEKVFPWLAPTRTSLKHPKTIPGPDAHPLQAFWGMPRRVRLLFEPANGRRCDLGGPADQVLVTGWETKQYGVKYEGWEHPLSPYTKKTGELSNPMKGSPGGVSYRHWLGLIVGDNSEGGRHPAACVDEFRERRAADSGIAGLRLLAFGYDMDNMKARAWYEAEMPIPNVSAAKREGFDKTIAKLIGGANMAARLTMSSVKRALHDRPADAKGDYSFIADRFWHDTETSFFNYLRELAAGDAGDDDRMLREGWLRDMRRAALTIFDDTVPTEGFENVKWRRIVQARQGLIWTLDGDDIRVKQLGLPARERHKARSTGLKKESKK